MLELYEFELDGVDSSNMLFEMRFYWNESLLQRMICKKNIRIVFIHSFLGF